jgi:hypothetical protein
VTPPDPAADAEVDEVDVAVGPDTEEGGGLFEPSSGGTPSGEATGASGVEAAIEQQRTAVLAWLSASLEERVELAEGSAVPSLRRVIADEAPDPVPALDGVPMPGLPQRSPPRVAAPLRLREEREDTATQIDPFAPQERTTAVTDVTPRPSVPLLLLGGGALLLVGAAFGWWLG